MPESRIAEPFILNDMWLKIYLKACLMGLADLVPGISGGTVAYITGIYPRLIRALSSFDTHLLRLLREKQLKHIIKHCDLGFLAIVIAGVISAILFFTKVLDAPSLIESHEVIFYRGCLIMMVGAVIYLVRKTPPSSLADCVFLGLGIILSAFLVALEPTQWPNTGFVFFWCGAIAITAMILPGISGSFLLVTLGKYTDILNAVKQNDYGMLGMFVLGTIVGVLLSAKGLKHMLQRHERLTIMTINGFVGGCTLLLKEYAAL